MTGDGVTTTDEQQAVIDGMRQLGEQLPFNRHLAVEVVEVRPGLARTRLPADERLANHVGEMLAPALRAADTGERPRFDVEVTVPRHRRYPGGARLSPLRLPRTPGGGDGVRAACGRQRRRRAAVVVLGCLALVAAGCTAGAGDRAEMDLVAEGDHWSVGIAPGPEVRMERRGQANSEVEGWSGFDEPPTVADAAHFLVPGNGRDVAVVVGPTPPGTTEVVLTSDVGASQEAALLESQGQQWFVAEVADTEATVLVEAFDADGAVLDIAEVDLDETESAP